VKQPTPSLRRIFRTLIEHKVDFIVVGGVCGVLHGAPLNTFDLDVVHSRDAHNIDRLLSALQFLGARYRTPGKGSMTPENSHLASAGHQLLMTDAGALDLLGSIGAGHTYPDLLLDTEVMEIEEGLSVRILTLPSLIRVKGETAQEKDKLALMILRRTLEERNRK
jgi:predicted nucleotidyltransferase